MRKYMGYTWAKLLAMLLLIIGMTLFFLGGALIILKGEGMAGDLQNEAYRICGDTYAAKLLSQKGGVTADPAMLTKVTGNMDYAVVVVEGEDAGDGLDVESLDLEDPALYLYKSPGYTGDHLGYYAGFRGFEYYYDDTSFLAAWSSGVHLSDMRSSSAPAEYEIVLYQVNDPLTLSADGSKDLFLQADDFTAVIKGFFSYMIPIFVTGLILSVLCCIWLVRSAGHRAGDEDIHQRLADRVPLGLYGFGLLCLDALGILLMMESLSMLGYAGNLTYMALFGLLALGIFAGLVIVNMLFVMSIAVRVKAKSFARTTASWYLILGLKKLRNALREHTSLMVRGLVILGVITFLQFMVIMATDYDLEMEAFFFFIYKCLEIPACLWLLIQFGKIMKGTKLIAEGQADAKIDTHRMYWDMRRHADDINHIGDGILTAVDARLRSERMKTELITNVSHDIKTPLTSIINYVDLLQKEPVENEKAGEYIDVLARQSARLKKLVGDLLDASKASTGNIEMHMEPCDLNVIMTQALGEFEERLAGASLNLVTARPETSVFIKADGRQLWRVFENLLSNICKYAMPGTRVYADLHTDAETAEVVFKNISEFPLNFSGDELTERFVRGDTSRSTEGSGLGLSIAESLCRLMNGRMQIDIDGDLFKVSLRFPLL